MRFPPKSPNLSDQALSDQAIEWLVRLQSSAGLAEQAEFAIWLAQSERHKRAFDDATRLWRNACRPTGRRYLRLAYTQ